jgi:hypothetical protein
MELSFWIVFYLAGWVVSFYSWLRWGYRTFPEHEDMFDDNYEVITFIWSCLWIITTPAFLVIFLKKMLKK